MPSPKHYMQFSHSKIKTPVLLLFVRNLLSCSVWNWGSFIVICEQLLTSKSTVSADGSTTWSYWSFFWDVSSCHAVYNLPLFFMLFFNIPTLPLLPVSSQFLLILWLFTSLLSFPTPAIGDKKPATVDLNAACREHVTSCREEHTRTLCYFCM